MVFEWVCIIKQGAFNVKKIFSMLLCVICITSFFSSAYAYSTGDDYPQKYKSKVMGSVTDEWNFYNRNCTSFAAWCLNSRNGVAFTNNYKGIRWGGASNWGTAARSVGITVNSTPAVGAVAWWSRGHVAWVKAVSGNSVIIEEYNSPAGSGNFNSRLISASACRYIHIKDINATAPATPQITSITGSGCDVAVKWNAVDNAEKYIVDFWVPNGSHNYYSTTATSLTQSLPEGQYGIRVAAENSAGQSVYTGFHYLWVSKSAVPEIPTITGINVSGSSVTVSWSATAVTNSYTVDFWDVNGGHSYFTTSATSMTKTLSNGRYGIRVSAENTAGASGYSDFSYVVVGSCSVKYNKNGGSFDDTYRVAKNIDAVNAERGSNQIVAYTTGGGTTGTNKYGYEVIVGADGRVSDTNYYVGNSAIPNGGMVLSGHGDGSNWLDNNIEIGDYVVLDAADKAIYVYSETGWENSHKVLYYGKEFGELPVPRKDGFKFKGWSLSQTDRNVVASDMIVSATGDIILYAQWTPETIYSAAHEEIFNGKTYLLYDVPLLWSEAEKYCENMGGHLADISTYEENEFIKQLISKGEKTGYWLGATDEISEGEWKWVTGAAFSFTDWYGDNPNNTNGTEHYLEIRKDYDNQWNDDTIDKFSSSVLLSQGFICVIRLLRWNTKIL